MKNVVLFKNYNKGFIKLNNNNINIFFSLFSSSKFVEYLILKLNKNFFNTRIEKRRDKKFKNTTLRVSTNISNYLILKKYLNFELSKEKFKFQLLCIGLNENKISVDFFENNFLSFISKEEVTTDEIIFYNYYNLIINEAFFIKIYLFINLLLLDLTKKILIVKFFK